MFNFIRALCVFFLFALLTACAANGNSERAKDAPILVGIAGAMLLALDERKGNNDGGGNSASAPMQMTMPTVTMGADFDSPNIGAVHFTGPGARTWLVVLSLQAETQNTVLFGESWTLRRSSVAFYFVDDIVIPPDGVILPEFNRASLHATGDLIPLVSNGVTVTLDAFAARIAFQGAMSITTSRQLCPISWLTAHINARFGGNPCSTMSGMSYSPDIGRVVFAAMSDGFNRGVIVGESALSFSGRYDGDNRAAGLAYDFGNFQMRTDYIRLPSKQDGEVWLDTYRLGIIRPLNDETRIFAGMDSYDNAIMAIDINTESKKWHRLGAAMSKTGKEYAIRYELRLNL